VCAKGTRFLDVADHPDRVLFPLRRRSDGAYERLSWPDAMRWLTQRLRPLLAQYGPHAMGIYFGNPLVFNTLGALTMLGLMQGLGTRNVFTAGSQDCNNKFAGAQILHGSPLIHPLPDFAHTDLAVLLGTNPAVSQASFVHLEGGSTVFDRLVQRGGRVVWIDPRRTESAQRWGEHLPIRPGTDIFLLLALLHTMRHLYRPDPRVEGLDTLLQLAAAYPPERAAALTGIPRARIDALATAIRTAPRATFHMSVGVNQGPFGTLCYLVLHALALLTGHCDRQGGWLFHPVAVWVAALLQRLGLEAGSVPSRVGHVPSVLGTLPGGLLAEEILTPGPEHIRALLVVAGNPLVSIPGEATLRRALHSLDALICLDLFCNTTGQEADLVLPTTSWLERGDVALTTALWQHTPLLQYTGPLRPAPGEARSEARILADMSWALGRPLWHSRVLTHVWRLGTGETGLAALLHGLGLPARWLARGASGLPWPQPQPGRYLGRGPCTPGHRLRCWHPDLAGEPHRLAAYAATLTRPALTPRAGSTPTFTLLSRRRRLGHNSWLHGGVHDGPVEQAAWMALADCATLGLRSGSEILLHTAQATLRVPVRPRADVAPGTVVLPHGLAMANVNALIPTGLEMIEPVSGQHRLTGLPVRVTPVPS